MSARWVLKMDGMYVDSRDWATSVRAKAAVFSSAAEARKHPAYKDGWHLVRLVPMHPQSIVRLSATGNLYVDVPESAGLSAGDRVSLRRVAS